MVCFMDRASKTVPCSWALPQFSYPPGYGMTDTADWNKGCKPKVDISCVRPQRFKFLELPNTDFWVYDINISYTAISFKDCKKLCRRHCQCKAFGYNVGSGQCYTKNELFNGRRSPGKVINIYLKVPRLGKVSKTSVPQVYQPVCSAINGEALVGSLQKGRMPASLENGYRMVSSQFKKFTYKEFLRATGKFKDEPRRGGSGAVYKGVLDDKRVVAVKKLEGAIQVEEEFWVAMPDAQREIAMPDAQRETGERRRVMEWELRRF